MILVYYGQLDVFTIQFIVLEISINIDYLFKLLAIRQFPEDIRFEVDYLN